MLCKGSTLRFYGLAIGFVVLAGGHAVGLLGPREERREQVVSST